MLYERYALPLYNYAIQSWYIDEDGAWDIIYKVLFKITEHIANYQFKSETKFKNLLYTTFNNELINYYRKTKKYEERLKLLQLDKLDFKDTETSPVKELKDFWEEQETKNPVLDILNQLLDELDDWERILVVQHANGMSYQEIAEFVDKPEEQLKVYYKRIKEKLSKELKKKLESLENEG